MLMKIAIALVAWQSNYGKIDKLYDVDTKTIFGIEINPYDVYKMMFGPELLKKYATGILYNSGLFHLCKPLVERN